MASGKRRSLRRGLVSQAVIWALCQVGAPRIRAQAPPAPAIPSTILGTNGTPDQILGKVGLDQKLNAQVPMDLTFVDEGGRSIVWNRYFGGKPVLLNLIQYRCTMLCSQEMATLLQSLKRMRSTVGDQFDVITVSIDPRETPQLATAQKAGYLKEYGRSAAAAGWHFLTGDEKTILRLADAVGYRFTYDPRTNQFAHPDGLIVLTPLGRIARYFGRLQYPASELQDSLAKATDNQIGAPIPFIALICYHYDPATGTYSFTISKLLQWAAAATMILLGLVIAGVSYRTARARDAFFPGSEEREG